jgi:signal transduction histidine kinase
MKGLLIIGLRKTGLIFMIFCLYVIFQGCSNVNDAKDQKTLESIKKYSRNYNRVGITAKTKKEADSVGKLLLSFNNTKKQRDVLINYIFYVNDGKKFLDELFKRSKDDKDIRDEGYANYLLADLFNKTYQKDSTYYYLSKSEFLLKAANDSVVLQDVYLFKAGLLLNDKVYAEGQSQVLKSMKLNRSDKSLRLKYNESILMTEALKGLEQYKEALEGTERSLKYLEDPNIKDFFVEEIVRLNKVTVYATIAEIYFKQKEYKKSKELILNVMNTYINGTSKYDSILLSKLLFSLAEADIALQEYSTVEANLKKAMQVEVEANNLRDYYNIKNLLAKYYYLVSNKEAATNLLTEVIDYGKSNKDLVLERDALQVLLQFNGDNYQANFVRYQELNHLIQDENNRVKNMFVRMNFVADDLQKANKKLQDQKKLMGRVGGGLFLFAIFVFLFILFRQKSKEISLVKLFQKDTEKYYDSILNIQNELAEARNIERKEIAQELHDGVLNRLFVTRFLLMQITKDTIEVHRESLINEVRGVEEYIRDVSHTLIGNEEFKIKEFDQLITDLVEIQNRNQAVNFSLSIDERILMNTIDIKYKVHIYRIIQECLQNVHKHAKATVCNVSFIVVDEHSFKVVIADDGVGIDTSIIRKGLGFTNIRNRAKLMNSKLIVDSTKGKGTTIFFVITTL